MAMRELPAIWERQWGYRPLLAETFCDIERTAGACYHAADGKFVDEVVGLVSVVDTDGGQRPRHDSEASAGMLAECPDGSQRHARRGLEPLNGQD